MTASDTMIRKRRIVKLIFSLGIILSLAQPIYSTNGMKVIGIGPVQSSMGGANVALPLDSAVSVTNPAAMIKLDKRADISCTFFDPHVSYKATSNSGMVTNNDTSIKSNMSPCYIPAFGITLPLSSRYTFGLGAYGVCGMGVRYPNNLYRNVTYTKYQFMKFAPAIAHRFNSKISVGAALNLDYATMEFNAGSTTEKSHNDGEAFGIGATFGTLYEFTDMIALGLAYESKQAFSHFRFNTPAGTDKLRLNQPQNLTIGLAVRPTDRLRTAFDISWIDWPQTMGRNQPAYTQNRSGATAWNMSWDKQFVYKLGLEYDLNQKTKLRFGYNYAKHPLDSSRAFENISFPAIAEHHITGGLAIKLTKKLILNLGVVYAPKVSFKTANANQFIDNATTEMYQCAVDVGISYLF